jgi:hypothetical protein
MKMLVRISTENNYVVILAKEKNLSSVQVDTVQMAGLPRDLSSSSPDSLEKLKSLPRSRFSCGKLFMIIHLLATTF